MQQEGSSKDSVQQQVQIGATPSQPVQVTVHGQSGVLAATGHVILLPTTTVNSEAEQGRCNGVNLGVMQGRCNNAEGRPIQLSVNQQVLGQQVSQPNQLQQGQSGLLIQPSPVIPSSSTMDASRQH
jgi:hypothetical protein